MKFFIVAILSLSLSQAFAQSSISSGSTAGPAGNGSTNSGALNQPTGGTVTSGTNGNGTASDNSLNEKDKANIGAGMGGQRGVSNPVRETTDCSNLQGKARTNCLKSAKVKK